ncbi:MAG: phytoene/squalene synthase family protein [Arenicella sp.]|jgi:phytoene synthase|nr:phytoene/squalene synthase family protein [Arenicella sp.]
MRLFREMQASLPDSKVEKATAVLAANGKSFAFAGKLLDTATLFACARLYRFCRYVDDVADEATDPVKAARQLASIKHDLVRQKSHDPLVSDFILLARDYALDVAVVNELLDGIASDLGHVLVQSEAELLRYCYRVAGTVGVLMCNIFNVRSPAALAHAIDLGIAMQLTNICRDVVEDAKNGRRYIPADMIGDLSPKQILAPCSAERTVMSEAVRKLLSRADHYYQSGAQGYWFLPARIRFAIAVAARVYREIGTVLRARGLDLWGVRAYVKTPRKYMLALAALWSLVKARRTRVDVSHNTVLHQSLEGLPYANS